MQLSSSIIANGRAFYQALGSPRPSVTLSKKDCEGVPEAPRQWQLLALARGLRSNVRVDANSAEARRILRYSTNEDARKRVYIAQNSSTSTEIEILEQLLRDRGHLAALVGEKSYSHMLIKDKMGGSPGRNSQTPYKACELMLHC